MLLSFIEIELICHECNKHKRHRNYRWWPSRRNAVAATESATAGLHGASKSLALELASPGITVNVVAPGIIASPMADNVFSKEMIDQMVPMKRAGRPDEVAALVNFLASDQAGYISGQVISINGGMA